MQPGSPRDSERGKSNPSYNLKTHAVGAEEDGQLDCKKRNEVPLTLIEESCIILRISSE